MAIFNAKWKLESSSNCNNFMEFIGYGDQLEEIMPYNDPANNIIEEYQITEKETRERVYKGGKTEYDYEEVVPRGTDVPYTDMAGKKSTVTTTINGNTMVTTQKLEDGIVLTYTLKVTGNTLEQEMKAIKEGKIATANRKLQKVK